MGLITTIILVLLCFSVTEFILPSNKRIHEQLYKVAFFITFFLFTIKYYYGADVINYYKVYNNIPNSFTDFFELAKRGYVFEEGFMYFMALIKWLGFSYWWMTAIVSIIYFYAIYKLFELIPSYKILALFILVVLEYNLIFATHRQCLAVSFYILLYFAYINKQYFRIILYSVLVVAMHKSGIVIIIPTLLLWFINYSVRRIDYLVSLILFIFMAIMPLQQILMKIVTVMPLSEGVRISLEHHILFSAESKAILLFYALIVFVLCIYTPINNGVYKKMFSIVLIGSFYISLCYQYNAILWRVRSYFIPFLVVYFFYIYNNYKDDTKVVILDNFRSAKKIITNSLFSVLFLCVIYIYYHAYMSNVENTSRIYENSTVFDLLHKSEDEIKKDRLGRAAKYWKLEFKKKEKLKN